MKLYKDYTIESILLCLVNDTNLRPDNSLIFKKNLL